MSGEVTLTVSGDGAVTRRAWLAVPESGSGPAVLVLHAWWGLNPFFTRLCDRLAAEGFVAIAPDLYGGPAVATVAEAQALVDTVGAVEGGRIIDAALDLLLRHDAVSSASAGVIGFSMGAFFAAQTATTRPDDVAAVVLYYGTSDHDFATARAAFLGHFAEDDPYEEPAWVAGMEARIRASGNPVTFYTYPGTGHWFAEDDRPDAYNPAAAALAWERTVAFLRGARGSVTDH